MDRMRRRQTTRFQLTVPFWLRLSKSPETLQRLEATSNISGTGLYFVTELPLEVGTPVDISLRMPEIVAGKLSRDWFCRGTVVRLGKLPGWKSGISVEFQFYEVVKSSNNVSQPVEAKANSAAR